MTAADGRMQANFLSGAGEMGPRIRAFDWTKTPLGPIDAWPPALKTSVSLILSSRHPMWIGWGPEMTFLYNDAYLHVLGPAKHPGALGLPAAEVWAEIWDVCGPLADRVFRNGEASFVDDVRLFMDRGSFVEETFYSFSYSPIPDDSGRVCGLFCPSTDVTPKVLNARRLATLSELAGNALVERTTHNACLTAARTLARNPDDIPFALLYLADPEGRRASLTQAVGTFAPGFLYPLSVDLREGAPSPWPIADAYRGARSQTVSVEHIGGLPLGTADQRIRQAVILPVVSLGQHLPYGVLVAGVNPGRPLDADHLTFFELIAAQFATAIQNVRSIEEEKKRADMLAELDRAKTLFFSNVSHEFRTPLTLMLGPLENLLAQPESMRPEVHQELGLAHRNSLRLLKLVNSLLDFSRLEAGRLKASYAPADLAASTADLASSFRSTLETAGLRLIVDCSPLSQPVYVDAEMWEKIVLNLLSNAFKFTFEGSVAVRVFADGDQAVLTVSDTGIGIPEEELPRIFERFHRVEGAQGRTYEGTGIGLALIKEYVKLHSGAISVASRPGAGSTFTVTLPFGTAHLPPDRVHHTNDASLLPSAGRTQAFTSEAKTWSSGAIQRPAQAPPAAAAKPRILVADDNADMREHVTRVLGEEYDVVAASDGQQALELIRRHPPDVLLSDVMMPGLDGFDLLRAVRADTRTQTLPIIFLSARAGEESRVEGLQAGADDYLVKPFTARELHARVATHLRMARARRQAAEHEAALRVEAETARDEVISILESITDGFLALNSEWRVTYLNREGQHLLGIGRADALGQEIWQLFPAAVGTAFQRELLRAVRENLPVDLEHYYAPWRRWFHTKAFPNPSGGLSVFYQDITAQKTADDALRRSDERFRAIVDTSPECVKVVAADGTLLQMNSAGLAMVEAGRPEDAIGKNVYDLIAPEFRQQFRVFNEAVCRGEKGSLEFDMIGLKGRRRRMETQAAPLRNPDGAMVQLAITRDVTDRKRREQAALLLSAIVDSSDDAIVSKDLNGVITSWNKSAERVFGYTVEETVGKSITILIPPDRLDEEPQILARLRRGERVDHFETVRRRKDGTLLDIALTISPVKDARGKIIGASKIARDITDRKRAERAIEALNAQLTADLAAMTRMQQLSARLVQTSDFPHLLDEILDAAIEITGADTGDIQLLEDGVLRIVSHRGLTPPFLELFKNVRSGESACAAALHRGERLIVEDVAVSPLFDAGGREAMRAAGARAVQSTPLVSRSGEMLGVFSTHYRTPRRPGDREFRPLDILARLAADLIERRRAEQALRASQARFRQLADAMPQIVWTAQPDGSIDYYNERCYEFTGFPRDQFSNEAWVSLLHPDDAKGATAGWIESVRTGRPYRFECRLWDRHDKRWRWFLAQALPAADRGGAILKWFGTTTDIDEQKRVEDELRRVNQDLEQFAYSASHDLQEPLRTIKIYGELLASRYATKLEGDGREFIEFLRNGANRMESLVRDLLAYTQAARLELPTETIDANQVLVRTISNLDGAIKQCGASVICSTLPSVRVDATHLGQLFQNLIGNAVKYRHPERAPVVHVGGRKENGFCVFSVRDNGIGIAHEYKEQIFGLFKRLHTGEEYSGTGIGLAICQRIVERYRGRIWVESELGQGSTFFFTIPL